MFLFLAVAHAADPVVQVAAGDLLWCERSAAGAVTCHGKKAPAFHGVFTSVAVGRDTVCVLAEKRLSCQGPASPTIPMDGKYESVAVSAKGGCAQTRRKGPECWGDFEPDPAAQVPDGEFTSVSVGVEFTMALSAGEVVCWGSDFPGRCPLKTPEAAVVEEPFWENVRDMTTDAAALTQGWSTASESMYWEKARELEGLHLAVRQRPPLERQANRNVEILLLAQIGQLAESCNVANEAFYRHVEGTAVNWYYYLAAVVASGHPALLRHFIRQDVAGVVAYYRHEIDTYQLHVPNDVIAEYQLTSPIAAKIPAAHVVSVEPLYNELSGMVVGSTVTLDGPQVIEGVPCGTEVLLGGSESWGCDTSAPFTRDGLTTRAGTYAAIHIGTGKRRALVFEYVEPRVETMTLDGIPCVQFAHFRADGSVERCTIGEGHEAPAGMDIQVARDGTWTEAPEGD